MLNDLSENFNKQNTTTEIDKINKNQLEMKNIVTEMKSALQETKQ